MWIRSVIHSHPHRASERVLTTSLDTDIHIPFFVRGPDIAPGGSFDMITAHTDVAATVLQIAGVSREHDGAAIPLHSLDSGITRHEHASIEYWGAVSMLLIAPVFQD